MRTVLSRLASHPAADFIFGVGASVLTRALLVALGVVASVIVTRALGPNGRGLYAVAFTITAIGSQICLVGLNRANIWAASRGSSALGSLVGNSLAIPLAAGSAFAAVTLLVALAFPAVAPVPMGLLILSLASVPLVASFTLLCNLFVGTGRVHGYNLLLLANRAGSVVLMVGLVVVGTATVNSLFATSLVMATVGTVTALAVLSRLAQGSVRPDLGVLRGLARYGATSYVATLLIFALLRIDVLLVNQMLGPEATGYYAVAVLIVEALRTLSIAVGPLLLARLSRSDDAEWRWASARTAVALVGVSMGGVCLMLALLAGPLVTFLYGEQFAASIPSLLILLPGVVFLSVHVVLMAYLGSIGLPRVAVLAPLLGLLLNLGLNLLLIPAAGIEGASAASTVAYAAMALTLLAFINSGGHRTEVRSGVGASVAH